MALLCILYLAGFAVGQLIPSSHIAASTSNGRTLKKPRNLFRSTLQDRSKHRAKVHRDIIEGGRKPPADYGGRHPFELMAGERRRRRREQKSQQLRRTADIEGGTFNEDWFEEEWELEVDLKSWYSEASNPFNRTVFKPIRIALNFEGLPSDDPGQRRNRFIMSTMTAATQFWEKSLTVFPARSFTVDPDFCENAPLTHKREGVQDVDLILYVSAENFCGTGVLASAAGCSWDQYNRPLAGNVKFCYDNIFVTEDGGVSDVTEFTTVETAIHEISHVLGMQSNSFAFFYDSETGMPRTPNPDLSENYECITGKEQDVFVPNENTMRLVKNPFSDIEYYELVTPKVAQVARNHFNCQQMQGMRLENQPTSPEDCFGSHWDERLLWNELMTALAESAYVPQIFSAFSFAVLEDSGWYLPNYSFSRIVPFGHGAGCDFVEKECIVDGNISPPFDDFFCNAEDTSDALGCDPNHNFVATCSLADVSNLGDGQEIPEQFQHFGNPSLGSLNPETDHCPLFSTPTGLSCLEQQSETQILGANRLPEEMFGDNSRCYNSNYDRPLCLETVCNEDTRSVEIVWLQNMVTCSDGMEITLPGSSEYYIQCPRLATVCPHLIGCPNNCAGNGTCEWQTDAPSCKCFDEKNESANCADLPSAEGLTVVPVAGSIEGKAMVEEFMSCQPWCGMIPNNWEEKCGWTYSCSLCDECASVTG